MTTILSSLSDRGQHSLIFSLVRKELLFCFLCSSVTEVLRVLPGHLKQWQVRARGFSYFPVGGAITHVSFSFPGFVLNWLQLGESAVFSLCGLYQRCGSVHLSPSAPPESLVPCFLKWHRGCTWWIRMSHRLYHCWGGGEGTLTRSLQFLRVTAASAVLRLVGSAAVARGRGDCGQGHPVTGGMRPQVPLLPLPGWLWPWALSLKPQGWHGTRSLCFWFYASSVCSSPPAFKCTDVRNCPASCCTGQGQLCWPLDVLLVVDWRGETKVAFQSAVLLMSFPSYNLIFLLVHSFVFSRHSVEIMQHLVFSSWLFSLAIRIWDFFMSFHDLIAHFFLVLNAIPVSGYTIIYPSTYLLLQVILLVSKFW